LIARRLALDVRQGVQHISRSASFSEILAHALFLRNVLYGSRTLSSFEQARRYQPSVAGLPVGFVTPDLQIAHLEQVARRTLSLLLKSKNSNLLDQSVLLRGTAICFYTKIGKKTSWAPGFVSEALPENVGVRRQPGSRGAILKIAYEDIRLALLWFDAGQPLVTSTPTAVNPLLTRGIQNSYQGHSIRGIVATYSSRRPFSV
jgi:hypothetical protein